MTSPLLGSMARALAAGLSPIFLDATLYRTGPPTGPSYDPAPGEPQSWPCKAIEDQWGQYVRQSGLVQASDRKVLILAATLATTPQEGDKVTIRGIEFNVVSDNEGQPAVSSDPALATWTLRCRV